MALNSENPEVTSDPGKAERLRRLLEDHIWPGIPPELLGQPPMSKEEREAILGYGPDGCDAGDSDGIVLLTPGTTSREPTCPRSSGRAVL